MKRNGNLFMLKVRADGGMALIPIGCLINLFIMDDSNS